MDANDRALLDTFRNEFNNQSRADRLRTGRFMTYESVMTLLREREHAAAAVARIDARIARILDAERNRRDTSAEGGE